MGGCSLKGDIPDQREPWEKHPKADDIKVLGTAGWLVGLLRVGGHHIPVLLPAGGGFTRVLHPQASGWGSGHSSPPVTTSYRKLRSGTVPLGPAEPCTPGGREPCLSSLCQRLFMHFIQLLLNAKCIRSPWSGDRNPWLGFAVLLGGADPLGQFPASAE